MKNEPFALFGKTCANQETMKRELGKGGEQGVGGEKEDFWLKADVGFQRSAGIVY